MKEKCVVLLSGGMDSGVLMFSLVEKYEIWPVTISYGQRHSKEVTAARNICEAHAKVLLERWKYVDLSVLRNLLPSTLTGSGDIPEGHYADENMKATVVPNRNMILLAIASGYAQGIGAKYVAYGPHMGDFSVYPDCREVFVKSIANSIKLGTGWTDEGVVLIAPFLKMSKADIVGLGRTLAVPFERTWSCYNGQARPCLRCGTCVERTMAFRHNDMQDPALTLEEWLRAVEFAKSVGAE
jgi:7-cyano-7-deazaguanine synthase